MKNIAKSLLGLILYILLIFGTAYLLGNFVVGQVEVDGPSMNDTLQDHDRVLMNKFTYRVKTLDRFDVIVFKYAYDTDTDYIKRVIGLPGETVRIDMDGKIYIDDELLVGITNLHCGLVVVKIIFALAECESALADSEYVL